MYCNGALKGKKNYNGWQALKAVPSLNLNLMSIYGEMAIKIRVSIRIDFM